jgi:23S rRNA-/tRNA-specific pseudouridylate synthase
MSGLGHPILGDYQYGRTFRCAYRPPRVMLHAEQVEFTHPATRASITITAPRPSDFQAAVELVIGI